MTSRLKDLGAAGQAVWLDFVDRKFLNEGGLRKLVEKDGLTGVTSNPSIFEKAMGHGDTYDEGFRSFLGKADASITDAYESEARADIKAAAADLRSVYDRLGGKDGYVSLEVSPYVATDTKETIGEARRLWQMVAEPNLMVKVPGTRAGIPAIRQLIEDGLNINVTLIFSLAAYQAVAEAYMAGLEARVKKGEVWRRGSVISSWLLDLTATALAKDQMLEQFSGQVADSGEGHWTIEAAMEEAVPAYVLSAALFARYRSRVDTTFGDKLLSAMRFGFGGHVEMPQ